MEINLDEIKHIAKLAKIDLTSQEEQLYTSQLASVLKWVEEIQNIDTSSVLDIAQNNFAEVREDVSKDCLNANAIRMSFNDREGNFLKVKKVL